MCIYSQKRFMKRRKNVFETLVFILLVFTELVQLEEQNENDYPEPSIPIPDIRYELSGKYIKLKCAIIPCDRTQVIWEYKGGCGPDLKRMKCYINENIPWKPINETKMHRCTSSHKIRNATAKDSGFYRCSKRTSSSEPHIPFKIYKLHVVEPPNYTAGDIPKFIETEDQEQTYNITEGSKLVISCKIYTSSEIPPVIRWLKQLDAPTADSISYNDKTYIFLNTSQIDLDNDTYISKLIIDNASEKDMGMYICIAINSFGKIDQNFSVNVITNYKAELRGTTSFAKYFLIPIFFVSIPMTVFLTYLYYRKRRVTNDTDTPTSATEEIRMTTRASLAELYQYELNTNYSDNINLNDRMPANKTLTLHSV